MTTHHGDLGDLVGSVRRRGRTGPGWHRDGRSWPVKRLVALPLIWLIRAYQLLLSPLSPPSCRFYPSCSAYAVTALERFGLFRGSWLTIRRLLHCHPWNPGGVDEVPSAQPSTRPTAPEHDHSHDH